MNSNGKWIMLTKKLPTNPSPPKLSIHWATPYMDTPKMDEAIKKQLLYMSNQPWDDKELDMTQDYWNDGLGWCRRIGKQKGQGSLINGACPLRKEE